MTGSAPVCYLSTRDPHAAPATLGFSEVLLAGLAEDGGLYVPDRLPRLTPADLRGFSGLPYAKAAARIVSLFAGDAFPPGELERLMQTAYRRFRHAAVAP